MNIKRVEQLRALLKESPDDPFLLYALALEHKQSDAFEAYRMLERLLNSYPEYLPAYYQAGAISEHLGKYQEALTYYKRGMELAEFQKDSNTFRELRAAYEILDE